MIMFAKDTSEYYYHVQKNMYELCDFAADKFGRTVFFNPQLSMAEKAEHALLCADLMLNAFKEKGEEFFLVIAKAFLVRMENDFCYRGGTKEQVMAMRKKKQYAASLLEEKQINN